MSKWEIPPKGGHMDLADGIYFQNMTTKEVEERLKKCDLIILPIGSTENHGPHACYGEDTFLVTRIAETVAKKTGCTIAQPLWYGSHPFHHLGMPGTIPIDENIFTAYISQMIAGFWNAGFRKQIILNGHGQEYVLPTAIHRFAKKYQVPGIFINLNWYYAIPQFMKDKAHGGPFETPFIHADEAETSVGRLFFPDMVDMSKTEEAETEMLMPGGHMDTSVDSYGRPSRWSECEGHAAIEIAGTPEGVVGKPGLGEANKAKKPVLAIMEYLTLLIDETLEAFPAGTVPPTEKVSLRDPKELAPYLKEPMSKGWKSVYSLPQVGQF